MEFNVLEKVVSYINNWYDFTNTDSVSVTLVFITIITLFCVVYNLLAFLKEKCREDEGLEPSSEISVSTGCCSKRMKGNKEPVPGYSAGNAGIIHDIHFYGARMQQKPYEQKCIALLRKFPHAINTPNPPTMYTPFLRACFCGNARAIIFMLKNGADITSCTKDGDSPMYLAVYRLTMQPQAFDPSCINILLNAGCDINTPRNHGYTPLHLAAKGGNIDLVRWLLAHGADPGRVTKCNKKAVDFARKYGQTEIVSLLSVCIDDEVDPVGLQQDQNNQ